MASGTTSERTFPLLTVVLSGLAACSPAPVRVSFDPEITPDLVWPSAPDAPRIAFLGAFATPGDVGVSRSTLSRIWDLVAGSPPDTLVQPMAVAATAGGGRIFIADPGSQMVYLFDRTRGRFERLRRADDQPLPSPVGLALGPDGRLFLTDSQLGGVFTAEPGSSVLHPLALQEELAQPTGIALDPGSGRLFVAETAAHRVSVFDRAGRLLERIGSRGTGDGEFNFPTYLWLDAGRLIVADSLNFRVQLFDTQNRFTGSVGALGSAPGSLPRPKGVAVDSLGHIYVVDGLLHDVQIFDRDGALLMAFGAQGEQPGEFWLPSGLWIAPDDTIYVADSRNRRVQVFRYVGPRT